MKTKNSNGKNTKCFVGFLNAYTHNINTSKTFSAITSVSEPYELKVKRTEEKIIPEKFYSMQRELERQARALFLNFVTMQQTVERNIITWNLRYLTSVGSVGLIMSNGKRVQCCEIVAKL